MNLLTELKAERDSKYKGGLYHRTQILFAYNSNHIEGSRLTEEQTRFIFETKSFFPDGDNPIRVDDVVETTNHFRLFDYMLDHAEEPLTEAMVKVQAHQFPEQGLIGRFPGAFPTPQPGVVPAPRDFQQLA